MAFGRDDYEIATRLVVDDAVDRGVGSAQRKLNAFEQSGLAMSSRLSSIFGGMFAGALGGAGVGALARGVIGVNSAIQEANAGMATLFSGLAGMDIGSALSLARSEVQGLREDAARGVGELENYRDAYQMLLGPGLAGGASLQQLRELTRNSLAAGFAMRGGAGLTQAPMDIVQALTSGVNDRQTPIALAALKAVGVTAEKFRQMNTVQRIETLNKAFGAFSEGVELMGQTWDARMSTLRDGVKNLFQVATQPLFDRWSEGLERANGFIERHQSTLNQIATQMGETLVGVWDHLIEQARTYAAIVAGASAYQLVGGAAGVRGLGSGNIPGIGRMAGLRNDKGQFRSATWRDLFNGGLSGAAGSIGLRGTMTSLGAIMKPLARLAGPLALVAGLFQAVQGAIGEYPELLAGLASVGGELMSAFGALGEAFGGLTAKGSILNMVGGVLIMALAGLGRVAAGVVRVIAALVEGFGLLARTLGNLVMAIGQAVTGNFLQAKKTLSGVVDDGGATLKRVKELFVDAAKAAGEKPPESPGIGATPKQITNINGPITVEIRADTMEDPARVAMTLSSVLDTLRRNPQQARRPTGLVPT